MNEGDNRLPELADLIRVADDRAKRSALAVATAAIEAGHALIEAKALVGHGKWEAWLQANCTMAVRSAQRYMRIARSGLKSATVADLGIAAAADLINGLSARSEFKAFAHGGFDRLADAIPDLHTRVAFMLRVSKADGIEDMFWVLLTEQARQVQVANVEQRTRT